MFARIMRFPPPSAQGANASAPRRGGGGHRAAGAAGILLWACAAGGYKIADMPSSDPSPLTPPSPRDRLLAAAADFLPVVFSVGFLFQCALLPLVGKAAFHGSHSPGAARALWAAANVRCFTLSGVLLLAIGALALFARASLSRRAGVLPVLLAVVAFMVLAAPFGLFAI